LAEYDDIIRGPLFLILPRAPPTLNPPLLTYCRHLESLRKKLTSRVAPLRWLAGSAWGAGVTTLLTATLSLVHLTTEYCAPVWCHSAHTAYRSRHQRRLANCDCVPESYTSGNLPVLADIQPAELRRNGATLSLAGRAMEPGHLLHPALTRPLSVGGQLLISRHLFVPAAQQLISSSDNNIRAAHWADHQWNAEWAVNPTRLRIFPPTP